MSAAPLPRTARNPRPLNRPRPKPPRSSPPLRAVKPPTVGRRRARFVLVTGVATAGLLFGVVTLQALVSQQSFDIQRSQDRVTELRLQADDLHLEVASLLAPERIAKAAARLGMVLPEEVHAVSVPAPGGVPTPAGSRSSVAAGSP